MFEKDNHEEVVPTPNQVEIEDESDFDWLSLCPPPEPLPEDEPDFDWLSLCPPPEPLPEDEPDFDWLSLCPPPEPLVAVKPTPVSFSSLLDKLVEAEWNYMITSSPSKANSPSAWLKRRLSSTPHFYSRPLLSST